jgi:aspartate/methionine/tyrosine aminotransferase
MALTLNPHMARTFAPPVMEARRWAAEATLPPDMPLLNLSQAAPVDPPPGAMLEAMAEIVRTNPAAHLYGPVLGLPELREEIAAQWTRDYGGKVRPSQVAITSGCNEAFCAVIATLAGPGDEVILPTPWYFNHKMALDMGAQVAVPLPTDGKLQPDPERAASLVTERTRAIVLISPNNPGGAEYPDATLNAFRDLARQHGIALIVDETYRDFHSQPGAPHTLFEDPGWDDTLIQLYSFSKAYRLTGHRVGAVVASAARLAEVEKYLDTVTICPAQIGQHAALWGMRNLSQWLAGERAEILARGTAMRGGFPALDGWELLGCGAYFAYVRHPYPESAAALAQRFVSEIGLLMLPGTMFRPTDDPAGAREFRLAFANLDAAGIGETFRRLAALQRP